ncbi:MAG: CDP-diacylglycerol--serine O-phosphatidyltransferase [Thermodesulfobacteriota bacterium]
MKIRHRIKPDNVRKGIYIIPNLFTSASLFGGFYAMVAALDGNFYYAAVAILISCLLDGMDGKIARLTNTSSRFGVEYDSLSDLVAFGVAPGFLIFTWTLRPFGRFGWLAAFLYVVCGALRLARFNVQIDTIESRTFNGLPVPAAASLVATTVLLFTYYGETGSARHITILLFIYLLAFLMVSNIKYHSFKELNLTRKKPFKLLVGMIFIFIIIANEPHLMLFLLSLSYVISGPLLYFWRKKAKDDDIAKAA